MLRTRCWRSFSAAAVVLAGLGGCGSSQRHARVATPPGPRVGIGDQNPKLFADPSYLALHTRIARYVAPYDAADSPTDLALARAWMAGAARDGVEPLVAFYHSRGSALRQPNVVTYTREVKRFIALFPQVREYEPWDEANRGTVAGSFTSPDAALSAKYYAALRHACPGCSIVALDVLDTTHVAATVRYVRAFERALGSVPHLWGLHNYSDTNRGRDNGTRAILAAVPGEVWLTETGGIVRLGRAFAFDPSRAARALGYMFELARSSSRITRLYIYNFYGGGPGSTRFDAGLLDAAGKPRPGYAVVRRELGGGGGAGR